MKRYWALPGSNSCSARSIVQKVAGPHTESIQGQQLGPLFRSVDSESCKAWPILANARTHSLLMRRLAAAVCLTMWSCAAAGSGGGVPGMMQHAWRTRAVLQEVDGPHVEAVPVLVLRGCRHARAPVVRYAALAACAGLALTQVNWALACSLPAGRCHTRRKRTEKSLGLYEPLQGMATMARNTMIQAACRTARWTACMQ